MEGIGERERGARSDPGTLPPLPPLGGNPILTQPRGRRRYATTNSRPATTAGRVLVVAHVAHAAATAAPARSHAVTPDGKRGCKTAGTGSASRARSALHTPDDRSKKIRNRRLGADPRTAGFRIHMPCPAPRDRHSGLGPPAVARRNDIGTAGSAPGVSPVRWPFADTVGWPVSATTAAPPRGTRDYSTGPGDASVERASHTL